MVPVNQQGLVGLSMGHGGESLTGSMPYTKRQETGATLVPYYMRTYHKVPTLSQVAQPRPAVSGASRLDLLTC